MQVAEARSDETFVALCLLTVTGASLLTQKLGFSDTMGAFVAGVLLAETNYSTQVRSLSPSILLPATMLGYFDKAGVLLAETNYSTQVAAAPPSVCLLSGIAAPVKD